MKIYGYNKKPPRIEMLPLIDIVFLLLVVFIYAMLSMAVHRGMPISLPTSSEAKLNQQTLLSITVETDGDIFVDKEPVSLDTLSQVLNEHVIKDRETEVLLFADRHVSYQDLFKVLDKIRGAGLERINLQAEAESTIGAGS